MFASLPATQTHIDFVNKPEEHELFNILYYLYYYNGGGRYYRRYKQRWPGRYLFLRK